MLQKQNNNMLRRLGISVVAVFVVLFEKSSAYKYKTCDKESDFSKYRQPDNVTNGNYDAYLETNYSSSICLRKCVPGDTKICYYKFTIELYSVLSEACGNCSQVPEDCFSPQCITADGFERAVEVANRQLPGPSIQVCADDWIIVDIDNHLPGISTSIHWHGQLQRKTPWMDGVPMVTQCPILEGQTFRYGWEAEVGTHYWHSHEGLQKVNGLQGSLIVRRPESDEPNRGQYDFHLPSHVMFFQDWLHTPAEARYPGQRSIDIGQSPVNYMVSGRGMQLNLITNGSSLPANLRTPLAVFRVKQGYRYRFNFIGATCLTCPHSVTIQNHTMTVINIDGHNPVEPVKVDSMHMASGERYDMVLTASNPIAAYWILVSGLGSECENAHQLAILCYEGATCQPALPMESAIKGFDPGYVLNPYISNCTNETLSREICVGQLQSKLRTPERIRGIPDVYINISYDFYMFSRRELFQSGTYHKWFLPLVPPIVSSRMQNVSSVLPPVPLLTQPYDVPPSAFCKPSTCKKAASVCECTNVVEMKTDKVVEMLIYDAEAIDYMLNLSHPKHLHGYKFYIVEQSLYNFEEGRDPSSLIPGLIASEQKKSAEGRNISQFLPSKDTILIGMGGYAVIRILTDNPGFWFFHCHYAFHLETGMFAIFKVGNLSQMIPPPRNFPRCRQFEPCLDEILKWGSY